jgi:hypothetical protein
MLLQKSKFINSRLLICILSIVSVYSISLYAVPPTSNLMNCEQLQIVEAQYISHRNLGQIKYFEPPVGKFKILKFVSGKKIKTDLVGKIIDVKLSFDDGSVCVEPEAWVFKDSMLPAPESKWLLLLESEYDGIYQTYRGSYGRVRTGAEAEALLSKCIVK